MNHLSILALLCFYITSSISERLTQHTFEAPFTEVDNSGSRIASRFWRSSGSTEVNTNFIRLTPDRQSKKGALWSRKPIGVSEFSSVLKFRISGQGKNFYGDGIGWWIVDQGYYVEGTLHGFNEKFTGIGIIFDTFKNTENLAAHRDVTVLINDGTKTYEEMTENVIGCNTNVRYHAQRGDFSVNDASRAKILLSDTVLEILIDNKNSGQWTPCVNVSVASLPANWLQSAHVGLTATTGQLADNHDILSITSFSNAVMLYNNEINERSKRDFEIDIDLDPETSLHEVENAINKILKKLKEQDHFIEHQLEAVEEELKNLLGKLEKREDKSEDRIRDLEDMVRKEVRGSLDDRLTKLEDKMRDSVEKKMFNIESSLDRKMSGLQSKAELLSQDVSGGWKIPFLILLIIFFMGAGGLYWFYQRMKKMHLL